MRRKKDDIILRLETIEEELELLLRNFEEEKPSLSDVEFGIYVGLCIAYWKVMREINERFDEITFKKRSLKNLKNLKNNGR